MTFLMRLRRAELAAAVAGFMTPGPEQSGHRVGLVAGAVGELPVGYRALVDGAEGLDLAWAVDVV
ncbi:MAG TPA: hypothetical protein VMV92_35850 [Streptosporangiaceae bacterium]|nr:hypothetical protein [Streptosporangiaceae bacterium]